MNNQVQEEFRELIKEIIEDEIFLYLKRNNYFQIIVGKVIGIKNNRYSLDIGDTRISDVVNKSNVSIGMGDSVTILNRTGGNYSDCFILCKNGGGGYTIEELQNEIEKLKGVEENV